MGLTSPHQDLASRPDGRASWRLTVSETDLMTTAVVQITPAHRAFVQVAALFDDYRAHYGRPPSRQVTRDWLHDQLTQQFRSHQGITRVAAASRQARVSTGSRCALSPSTAAKARVACTCASASTAARRGQV
jgi:hypothetical protein